MGGIFNPPNLGLYVYGHQNPLKITDPDGRAARLIVPAVIAGVHVLRAANKARVAQYSLQTAQVTGRIFYLDRSPGSRPKDGGNVISAMLSEAATGEPAKEAEPGKRAKFHRDKAVGIVNSFINLKEGISKDKLLLKKQKQKLHRVIDFQIKPLKAAIEVFDKSPLTTADQKKERINPDKWKVK